MADWVIRRAYLIDLAIDTVMLLLAAVATVLGVARAWPRLLVPLSVAPVAFFALDVVENALFTVMVRRFPDVDPSLVALASPITVVKPTSFWFVTAPTLGVGLAVLVIRWALRRDAE